MENYVGMKLDGRYELLEILGIGGMSVVYKAYDNIESRTVAVKILKDEYVSNEEFLRRFKNESKAIAVLSHPNIVKVYDVSFGEKLQYIVMEHIEGITLKQLIEQQGSLRWKDALYYTMQILRGLQHAHDKGIVHRDIKPQNIMVLPDTTIKVTDFGIARFARSEQKTITDKAIGSVHYISPEQARGDNTDEKSDLYSLGVMLYEMLTGKLPFQAENAVSVAIMQLQREPELPTSINGSIPLGLEQITMHAMQKNAELRYKSASEMLCDLEAFKRDPSVSFDYGYFVDDTPTRYVGDLSDDVRPRGTVKGDFPWLAVIGGITTACFLAVILVLIILGHKLFGTTESIKCPKFVGKMWSDVIADPEYDKFDLTPEYTPSDFEKGYIISQSISEGVEIKEKSEIRLTVSSGAKTKLIPNVANKSRELCETMLTDSGFTTRYIEITDGSIAEGMVVRTNPVIGSSVPEGTEITVYVSTGKANSVVALPDCVGLSQGDAIRLLESKGLVLGTTTEVNSSLAAGTVVSQSPEHAGGISVGWGSAVDLYISTGGYPVTVTIDLPYDPYYKNKEGFVGIWDNDVLVAISDEISFPQDEEGKGTITLSFITTKESISNCYIKISGTDKAFVNYQEGSIDCVNNKFSLYRTLIYN